MPRDLATYLKDHYAGSAGGTRLCRQIADTASDVDSKREASSIADAIEADQRKLLDIMRRLDVTPSRFKAIGARLGELGGRGKLRASSADGRVLQFEAMIMGVTGKLRLWHSLGELAATVPGLDAEELEALKARAKDQRTRLGQLHLAAARKLDG